MRRSFRPRLDRKTMHGGSGLPCCLVLRRNRRGFGRNRTAEVRPPPLQLKASLQLPRQGDTRSGRLPRPPNAPRGKAPDATQKARLSPDILASPHDRAIERERGRLGRGHGGQRSRGDRFFPQRCGMTPEKKTPEHWAKYWCAAIESRGLTALSPQPTSSEDRSPGKSLKRKHKVLSPVTDTQESDDALQLEKQLEITGTKVIMVEDRDHLKSEVTLLRPAFDRLNRHIKDSAGSLEKLDSLFQSLGELIAASYYVGAYTTVSLGAQKFVTPAVLREKAKTLQRAKAVVDMEKRQRLRAAILKAASGRELKGSREFGKLIHPKVAAALGSEKDKWPSAKRIKDEIQVMKRERRSENKGQQWLPVPPA